ncbi:GmrSD restriction endonuclease domain-containing protein [Streptomyces antimycoticus]|uniref:GmrSD restriction endonuclease domain-containing protein n=1 Tax=Streptomyces antimycoticus TaxID=68175 RepID=UPI0033F6D6B5
MVAAAETTLQGLLEGTRQYLVPLYQRTYSWTELQLKRIWDDVCQLARDRADHPAATHFIGSLVLAPSPATGAVGVAEYLVVDGQQRLTTLTILLCAIRDHRAEHESPKHRLRLDQQYLTNPFEEQRWLKLVPTQADRDAYVACVRSTPSNGPDNAVGRAYRFFANALKTLGDGEEPITVEQVESAVITGLALVAITAKPGDNVYRIFESLNNTGLALTQADLLRNYIFMRLPNRGQAVYDSLWRPLQQRFTPTELVLLFWLDLVHRDPKVKQTDTYAIQQARLDKLRTEADVEAEVKRFSRLGALLRVILHPAEEQDSGVRQRLGRLSAWGTTTVYPVLLHLLDRRDRGTATSEQIASAMLYLESFFVRRLLIGRSTMNINRILLAVVTEMDRELPVDEAVRRYLSTGRKHWAADASLRAMVRTIPFYLHGRASQRSLVLRWLEESYGSKEPVALEKLTIEHVLPQTLSEEWAQMLGADLDTDETTDEAHEALVHTLGNLTLTGYNSELSNKPFAAKRIALAKSGVQLSRDVADRQRWGRSEILARADALAERIIAIWPGPSGETGNQSDVPWDVLAKALAELPAGSWTTYGDLAALIGTAPQPVGNRLANHPTLNAHRVLQAGGIVAGNFRWLEPGRNDDPRDVLRVEGVTFDQHGRADPAQRITVEELAQLAGVTPPDLPEPRARSHGDVDYASRFIEQLTASQGAAVATATAVVLDAWTTMGGTLSYGIGNETSCFLMARSKDHEYGNIWPVTFYPSGKCEVVFQHLSIRTPFDDLALREELRQRLNQLPDVQIAAARLALRPSFPMTVLADAEARYALLDHLRWFYDQAQISTSDDAALV